jgi:glycine/D-amino acid oxidase-like deaminating enzyme
VERAFDLWRDAEEESGQTLLNTCGMLTAGPAKGRIVPPVLAAREKYPFDCELLTPGEVNERFPAIGFPLHKDLVAIHEPGGGYLYADRALEAFASSARANGATLLDCHHVRHWTEEPGRVLVESEEGTFEAPFLILTTGPWTKPLLSQFGIEVTLLRKLVFWYLAENEALIRAGTMPSFAIESPRGIYYGVPDNHDTPEEGLKIGRHDNTPELLEIATLDSGEEMRVERWIDDQEDMVRPMIEAFAREYFAPGLLCGESRELVPSDMAVRQYCLSPDGHFLIGNVPGSSRIAAATGFSGHGFKFAPVVAEILADMAENKPQAEGTRFLRLDRMASSARASR